MLTIENIQMKRFNIIQRRSDHLSYLNISSFEESLTGEWCKYEDVLEGERENRTYWLNISEFYITRATRNTNMWKVISVACFALFAVTFITLI
jgi:hypothetical protein